MDTTGTPLKENIFDGSNGWVFKFPFKTNGDKMCFCSDSTQLQAAIIRHYNFQETGDIIPYGLIQPRLRNKLEYVVLLNGNFQHYFTKGNGKKFFNNVDDLKSFAEESLVLLVKAETTLNYIYRFSKS